MTQDQQNETLRFKEWNSLNGYIFKTEINYYNLVNKTYRYVYQKSFNKIHSNKYMYYLVFKLKISSRVIEYGFLPLTLNRIELPLNSDCWM